MKKRNLQNVFSSLERTKSLLPLRLQLFGDEGEDGDQEPDYKALYEKAKAEKDKASKEASDFKKRLKEKETAEETKNREDESKRIEMEENIAKLIKENQEYKLKSNLSKDNILTAEEIGKIVEARFSEDDSVFADTINQIIKTKLEQKEQTLRDEFKRNGRVPNGSSDSNNSNGQAVDFVKNLAEKKSQRNKGDFSSYFGKK